ncbi:MAG: hypothetical protein NZ927_04845 [Candidatus Calescibacterium sp.]|nr:hypothetical protein [Candidatus Calescibacterium sp.]
MKSMFKKKQEYEPVIAKGKKREFLKDSLFDIGENILDFVFERWKEILSVLVFALASVLIVSLILSRSSQKKLEEFMNFERASNIVAFAPNDITQIQNALSLIQNAKEPQHISNIYKAWMLFKLERKEEAVNELSQILNNEKAPADARKLAGIMKINIVGDCKEVIKTYEILNSLIPRHDPTKKDESKGYISTIPIRTLFEVAKCAKDRPDIIQKIQVELDNMYLIEQFLAPERAKNILIAKQTINEIVSKSKQPNQENK